MNSMSKFLAKRSGHVEKQFWQPCRKISVPFANEIVKFQICNISCYADAEAQDSNNEFAQQTLNSPIDERSS